MNETVTIPPESYIGRWSNKFLTKLIVGKYTSISNGLIITIAEHASSFTPNLVSNYPFNENCNLDYPKAYSGGKVIIGNDVWIGRNVHIIKEITVGDGAIVGASAVVAKDVPPYSIVIGNPLKILRYRFNEEQIKKLLEIKWWDWPKEKIYNSIKDFWDINNFIRKHESKTTLG